MREQLLYYALKYHGEYGAMKKAIEHDEEWRKVEGTYQYLTILDDDYPKQLFALDEPPYVLFYEGTLDLLRLRMIAVIGSRQCSMLAKTTTNQLISNMDETCCIVSGLAKGIDAYAHQAALQCQKKTIGIIGCGIDVTYPKENKALYEEMMKNHLILSEYPPHTAPLAHHFPWRNRIISALAEKCIVVEAQKRSGTMITVNEALNLGKEVVTFPYRMSDTFGSGCNEMIQQGASMILGIDDMKKI